MAIFVAMVLDSLDGRVARLTKTQSAFGAEFDSLSDMVSFGAAPALVMYEWVLRDLGKLGLDRGLRVLRVRGAAPRALQHDARRRRQALVHRHSPARPRPRWWQAAFGSRTTTTSTIEINSLVGDGR